MNRKERWNIENIGDGTYFLTFDGDMVTVKLSVIHCDILESELVQFIKESLNENQCEGDPAPSH